MLHTFAFAGAKTDSTADEAAPAPADQSMTRTANGNTYLMPFDARFVAACIFNDTITRARLNYPSYRDLGFPEIFPVNGLALGTANYLNAIWDANGPRIKKNEELGVDSSNGASTVDTIAAILGVVDRIDPVPTGRRFTVRGTATQTLVANQWTVAPVALSQVLPFGRYGVIGLSVTCLAAWAGRLIFPGTPQYRPGCPCSTIIGAQDPRLPFRSGAFGLLGSFDQTAPPQLEMLGQTAGAQTPAIILDLVEL